MATQSHQQTPPSPAVLLRAALLVGGLFGAVILAALFPFALMVGESPTAFYSPLLPLLELLAIGIIAGITFRVGQGVYAKVKANNTHAVEIALLKQQLSTLQLSLSERDRTHIGTVTSLEADHRRAIATLHQSYQEQIAITEVAHTAQIAEIKADAVEQLCEAEKRHSEAMVQATAQFEARWAEREEAQSEAIKELSGTVRRDSLIALVRIVSAGEKPSIALVRQIVPVPNAVRTTFLAQLSEAHSPTPKGTAIIYGQNDADGKEANDGGEGQPTDADKGDGADTIEENSPISYPMTEEVWKQTAATENEE